MLTIALPVWGAITLHVGYYENPPLVFTGKDGPAGLYVDLLTAVAEETGWDLQFVHCEWEGCLAALERGELDILCAIAYTEARASRFDFTGETVLSNWGQVYARPGLGISSPLDLVGLRLTGVSEDVYLSSFLALLAKLDVRVALVSAADYEDALWKVERGLADVAIVARLFGEVHAWEFKVEKSSILCCPVELRLAAPKGAHPEILATLDRYLESWKADPDSPYWQALDRWLGAPAPRLRIPQWLWLALATLAGIAAVLTSFAVLLRVQVRRRTRELEAERKFIDTIINTQPALVVVLDGEGRITYWNKACELLTGYTLAELKGKPVWQLIPQDELPQVKRVFNELKGTGTPSRHRNHWLTRSGDKRLIDWSNAVIPSRSGGIEYVVGAGVDVTALEQAQDELRESEARLWALLKHAEIGVAFTDENGKVVLWNDKLAELTGISPEEALGEMIWDLQYRLLPPEEHTPERYHSLREGLIAFLKTGEAPWAGKTLEREYVRPDGRRLVLRGTTFSFPTARGFGLASLTWDVTEEREAQRALAESEERYRAVFEAAGDGVFLMAGDVFVDVNPAGATLLGATVDEIVGTHPWDWSPQSQPDGRPSKDAALSWIGGAMAGKVQRFPWLHRRKDGTTFPAEVTLTPVVIGGRRYLIALVRDVSGRKGDAG